MRRDMEAEWWHQGESVIVAYNREKMKVYEFVSEVANTYFDCKPRGGTIILTYGADSRAIPEDKLKNIKWIDLIELIDTYVWAILMEVPISVLERVRARADIVFGMEKHHHRYSFDTNSAEDMINQLTNLLIKNRQVVESITLTKGQEEISFDNPRNSFNDVKKAINDLYKRG